MATGLPPAALEEAQALVRCDLVAFCDFDPHRKQTQVDQEYPAATQPRGSTAREPGDDPFWEHYWGCLPCCYQSVSGDERTITTISDFYSQRDYHNTGMYADVLATQGSSMRPCCA